MDLTELFSARLYLKLLFVQEEMTPMTVKFQQKVPNPEVPSHWEIQGNMGVMGITHYMHNFLRNIKSLVEQG